MVNELSARVFDLRLVCVSPYRPAACDKAALRGLTHLWTPPGEQEDSIGQALRVVGC
jgi:hypothetical protein